MHHVRRGPVNVVGKCPSGCRNFLGRRYCFLEADGTRSHTLRAWGRRHGSGLALDVHERLRSVDERTFTRTLFAFFCVFLGKHSDFHVQGRGGRGSPTACITGVAPLDHWRSPAALLLCSQYVVLREVRHAVFSRPLRVGPTPLSPALSADRYRADRVQGWRNPEESTVDVVRPRMRWHCCGKRFIFFML